MVFKVLGVKKRNGEKGRGGNFKLGIGNDGPERRDYSLGDEVNQPSAEKRLVDEKSRLKRENSRAIRAAQT